MRWIVLIVCSAALVVNGQEAKPHSNSHKRNSTAESAEATDTIARTVIVVNQEAPRREQDNHSSKPPSYLSKLFGPENLPNIALVLVGVGGITAALCTLRTISRQTKVMITQAKIAKISARAAIRGVAAAKRSADALVASERAWITVGIKWSPGYFGLYNGDGYSATVRMTYKNDGRTSAWITERRAQLKVFDVLPEKPPLESAEIVEYGTVPLIAGEEKHVDAPLMCEGGQNMDKLAVIFGVVNYRTVVGVAGQTVVGYSVGLDLKTLRPLESREWNINT